MGMKWRTDNPNRTYVRARDGRLSRTFGITVYSNDEVYLEIVTPLDEDGDCEVLNIVLNGDDFANAIVEALRKHYAGS